MSGKYCKFIQSGVNFHLEHIRFCNQVQVGPIISEYGKEVTAEFIKQKRQDYINGMEHGILHPSCEGCYHLKDENNNTDKIDYLEIFHWQHCNCGCVYCANLDLTKGAFSDKVMPGNPHVLRLIKEMYKRDEIDKENLWVCFGGGEVAVLKDFPKIVDLFLKNNVSSMYVQSSGITYSKTIEKILALGKGHLQVGISAGSRDVYEKIKRRDKYNQVVENLKKYIKKAKYKDRIVSKFIIIEGLNSTVEEVEKWLQMSSDIGIVKVEFSMEFCRSFGRKSGQKVEQYNYDLFDYAQKRCDELGIEFTYNEISKELMKKGVYN